MACHSPIHSHTHPPMSGSCYARRCQPDWEQLGVQRLAQGHFKHVGSRNRDLTTNPSIVNCQFATYSTNWATTASLPNQNPGTNLMTLMLPGHRHCAENAKLSVGCWLAVCLAMGWSDWVPNVLQLEHQVVKPPSPLCLISVGIINCDTDTCFEGKHWILPTFPV